MIRDLGTPARGRSSASTPRPSSPTTWATSTAPLAVGISSAEMSPIRRRVQVLPRRVFRNPREDGLPVGVRRQSREGRLDNGMRVSPSRWELKSGTTSRASLPSPPLLLGLL
jgi:hypothetical protein